jgi:hypothetical protein
LVIKIGKTPQLDVLDIKEMVHSMINGFQCEYDTKDAIYECIKQDGLTVAARASRLLAIGVDEQLIGPILELLPADSRLQGVARVDSREGQGMKLTE